MSGEAEPDDSEFEEALLGAVLARAAALGWRATTVAGAAREADLRLDRAREVFPDRLAVLAAIGTRADRAALEAAAEPGFAGAAPPAPRERLFDMLMRRLDVLQTHRAGVLAVFRGLPTDPAAALFLAAATARSMAWMLEGAGAGIAGLGGMLRVKLLTGAWLVTVRAWEKDQSPDLAATMAALDRALGGIGRLDPVFAPARDPAPTREAAPP